MSTIFNQAGNTPQLHAFIIAVDDYDDGGMNLTSTVPTAKAIARWLETKYNNPSCPLGSIEMILSPAQRVVTAGGSEVDVDRSSMVNIELAFEEWFRRCDSNVNNTAFFYFVGHGCGTTTQFLLASDFTETSEDNCINFEAFQAGMYRCAARYQFFFLDACRTWNLTASGLTGNALSGVADYRDMVDVSAVYRAAAKGRSAHGEPSMMSYFAKALIMCLDGVGAGRSANQWAVTSSTLASNLVAAMAWLSPGGDVLLSGGIDLIKPVIFHIPNNPVVLLSVQCASSEANRQSHVRVTQGRMRYNSEPGKPRPYKEIVGAGKSKVVVSFETFDTHVTNDHFFPPVYELEVPL